MKNTWILLANAHHARCLERDDPHAAPTELADFSYPRSRLTPGPQAGDISGDAGKGHGRTAHSGTQFEPHTDQQSKGRAEFAQLLADYLNLGVEQQRCGSLVLIATSPMLGELRQGLSATAQRLLQRCVPVDLTRYQGPELRQRIEHVLELP